VGDYFTVFSFRTHLCSCTTAWWLSYFEVETSCQIINTRTTHTAGDQSLAKIPTGIPLNVDQATLLGSCISLCRHTCRECKLSVCLSVSWDCKNAFTVISRSQRQKYLTKSAIIFLTQFLAQCPLTVIIPRVVMVTCITYFNTKNTFFSYDSTCVGLVFKKKKQ
jgi:hypothetical protein